MPSRQLSSCRYTFVVTACTIWYVSPRYAGSSPIHGPIHDVHPQSGL